MKILQDSLYEADGWIWLFGDFTRKRQKDRYRKIHRYTEKQLGEILYGLYGDLKKRVAIRNFAHIPVEENAENFRSRTLVSNSGP